MGARFEADNSKGGARLEADKSVSEALQALLVRRKR